MISPMLATLKEELPICLSTRYPIFYLPCEFEPLFYLFPDEPLWNVNSQNLSILIVQMLILSFTILAASSKVSLVGQYTQEWS